MSTETSKAPFVLVSRNGSKGPMTVRVVTQSMATMEAAREIFPYRPLSRYSESRFGGNNLTDDTALLLSRNAVRCKMCQAPTKVLYLSNEGICPDCDGRSEYNGCDPYQTP